MTALRSVLATYNAGMQLGLLRKSSSALRAARQRNQMSIIWIVCTPGRTIHSFARCHLLLSLLCHRLPVLFDCILIHRFRLLSIFLRLYSSPPHHPYSSRLCYKHLWTRKLLLMKRMDMLSGVERGGGWGFNPPPTSKFRSPSKIVPNSTRLWKMWNIAEFRTPTHQDVRKKVKF